MIGHLLFWFFTLVFLGWVTFPLTYRIFRTLPDRGFAFSRIFGLLLWGFVFWILAVLGVLQNTPAGVLFALMVVIGISIWSGWRQRQEIWSWVQKHWRLILTVELVFLMAFAFMTLVRASDPDATGTEKPMELAFINAILNSKTFPPHDPWLSGYAISYYHFGYILTAMLAQFTGAGGGVAFNLMLASVFGMSAVGAFGVLCNLLAATAGAEKPIRKQLGWALFGPLFLLFVSNLEGVLEVLHQVGVGWDMAAGTSSFWSWLRIEDLMLPPAEPLSLVPKRFWWWWQASRVIQDIDLVGNVSPLSPIDEFPAFSFVLGDLHPHVLVMPFVMLLIGLSLAIFRGGMDGEVEFLGVRLPYRLDLFAISAVTLGGIAFLNTWDLPVYFSLLTGAFLIHRVFSQGWSWARLLDWIKLALPLGIVSILLYLPFFIGFQSQAGGILPNLIYSTRGVYLWLMFGSLLVPLFLFFIWLLRRKQSFEWRWGVLLPLVLVFFLLLVAVSLSSALSNSEWGRALISSQGKTGFLDFLGAALVHRLRYGFGLLTLTVLLILGLSSMLGFLRRVDATQSTSSTLPFVLLMVLLGGLMVLGPEFLFLRDNFTARMNTIFKFYFQAWMLWSLAAGFAAVNLLKKAKWGSQLVVILVLLLGLVYPALAFPNKANQFSPVNGYTLDAGAYLGRYQESEAAAIGWLADAPDGVVAEAIGGQYSGYARVSTLSGQPTVLGWPGHEGQWRGGYTEVGSREMDIRNLYQAPDWATAAQIIATYDIRYIYVGSLERTAYAVSMDKFTENLPVAFERNGVTVFVVP